MAELRSEEIDEASIDDDAFSRLASRLAVSAGARSAVFHWRNETSGDQETSCSSYFSSEQMDVYSRHFATDDVWAAAVNSLGGHDRVVDCGALVPENDYLNSRIYNEWIRPMGDDTFHCLGGVISAGGIVAELGIHRGRAQAGFEKGDLVKLSGALRHLRQLVLVRSKLSAAASRKAGLEALFDTIGYGVFLLSGTGHVVHANDDAERMLARKDAFSLHQGRLRFNSKANTDAFEAALAYVKAGRGLVGALPIDREFAPAYEMSIVAVSANNRRWIKLILQDHRKDDSLAPRLRSLYQLTRAEADVALQLAATPLAEIADARNTSLGTVRVQVKAIAEKIGCRGQNGIISAIARLPKLNLH